MSAIGIDYLDRVTGAGSFHEIDDALVSVVHFAGGYGRTPGGEVAVSRMIHDASARAAARQRELLDISTARCDADRVALGVSAA